MNFDKNWKSNFDQEIDQAEIARKNGNEGMARVCARRAAGVVVGEFYKRRGIPIPGPSAYDRLINLSDLPNISPKIKEIANHLIQRVSPDYTLPIEADLIAEAHCLKQMLLDQES
jgi:hypothetical protein